MILSIWQLLYFYLIGLLLALLEIEIEGPVGWAKNLPTKRFKLGFYKKAGKDITGYHLILQVFLLLFMHLPLVLERRFNWELEILIITQYLFFLVYWDFLWIVLNPHYRLKKFKKGGDISWHASWLMGLPTEYWLGILIAVFLPVIAFGWNQLAIQLTYLVTYLIFVLITVLFYFIFFRKRL